MQTFQVKLSQLVTNDDNPRTITDGNLQKLITSILVFPKMLALRPIVVDNTMTALGGNMRLRALTAISTFSPEQIANRLQGSSDYEAKTPAEREALISYWRAWLDNPTTEVASDETLSEDERRAFIIKDNVGYGEWDTAALSTWDEKQLQEWNVEAFNLDEIEGDSKKKGDKENTYTNKIVAPTYEPSEECPKLTELTNMEKAIELQLRINKARVPAEIKEFLRIASYRHVVFDYGKIADFYAHASLEVQELMEDSALVIIDFNKAIEGGYVQLAKDVFSMIEEGGEDDEE